MTTTELWFSYAVPSLTGRCLSGTLRGTGRVVSSVESPLNLFLVTSESESVGTRVKRSLWHFLIEWF